MLCRISFVQHRKLLQKPTPETSSKFLNILVRSRLLYRFHSWQQIVWKYLSCQLYITTLIIINDFKRVQTVSLGKDNTLLNLVDWRYRLTNKRPV